MNHYTWPKQVGLCLLIANLNRILKMLKTKFIKENWKFCIWKFHLSVLSSSNMDSTCLQVLWYCERKNKSFYYRSFVYIFVVEYHEHSKMHVHTRIQNEYSVYNCILN